MNVFAIDLCLCYYLIQVSAFVVVSRPPNMTSYKAFHSQLTSIMEALAKAAVAEICELVDDSYAVLQLEITRSHKENEALRRKLELIETIIARGHRGNAAVLDFGGQEAAGGGLMMDFTLGEFRGLFLTVCHLQLDNTDDGGKMFTAMTGLMSPISAVVPYIESFTANPTGKLLIQHFLTNWQQ